MTSLRVRRIFEEIRSEQVVALDIYDPINVEFTTAKMLWATWKVHGVMERYLKQHFYEHPSISGVLAQHLTENYIKPDDSHASQIAALEKATKSLSTCLDKLEGSPKVAKDKPGKKG